MNSQKLDTNGGYRISWHQGQYWIVGNGSSVPCGKNELSAKYLLEGMTESPSSAYISEKNSKN